MPLHTWCISDGNVVVCAATPAATMPPMQTAASVPLSAMGAGVLAPSGSVGSLQKVRARQLVHVLSSPSLGERIYRRITRWLTAPASATLQAVSKFSGWRAGSSTGTAPVARSVGGNSLPGSPPSPSTFSVGPLFPGHTTLTLRRVSRAPFVCEATPMQPHASSPCRKYLATISIMFNAAKAGPLIDGPSSLKLTHPCLCAAARRQRASRAGRAPFHGRWVCAAGVSLDAGQCSAAAALQCRRQRAAECSEPDVWQQQRAAAGGPAAVHHLQDELRVLLVAAAGASGLMRPASVLLLRVDCHGSHHLCVSRDTERHLTLLACMVQASAFRAEHANWQHRPDPHKQTERMVQVRHMRDPHHQGAEHDLA